MKPQLVIAIGVIFLTAQLKAATDIRFVETALSITEGNGVDINLRIEALPESGAVIDVHAQSSSVFAGDPVADSTAGSLSETLN